MPKTTYDTYSDYYGQHNTRPDWDAAEKDPERHAIDKSWLPENRTVRILDFGCGWGNLLMNLWCSGYRNLEGVEASTSQAAVAVQCAGDRIPISCMDGGIYLEDKKRIYDLIILYDVFEHIPPADAFGLLLQIKEALADGGRLVIMVPNMASVIASYLFANDHTHVAGYTENSLIQILEQAGFTGHCIIPDTPKCNWRRWRPWAPWRGLDISHRVNIYLHKFLYRLSGKKTPTVFCQNIEVYSHKPDAGKA